MNSMKKDSFRVADHIWFFNWGLGGENTVNNKGWKIKKLDVIRKELNHTHVNYSINNSCFNFTYSHTLSTFTFLQLFAENM